MAEQNIICLECIFIKKSVFMFDIEKNLYKIDCYSKLDIESHVILSLYHIYKYKVNIQLVSPEIIFYEYLINEFNEFINLKANQINFINFISTTNLQIEEYIDNFQNEPWKYVKPIIWSDRNKENYYINNLTDSHRFEVYVEHLFEEQGIDIGLYYGKDEQYNKGESKLGIEIKNDKESLNTGNLYIEYKERISENGKWIESGILKDDNTIYWAIGTYENLFFIKKSILKNKMDDKNIKHVFAKRGTSRGFIIPIHDVKIISDPIDIVITNLMNK